MSALETETPGVYWVLVNLLDGGSHRYSIHAVDGQDAEEYISKYSVPKDYPGQRFEIAGCSRVRDVPQQIRL